MNNVIDWKRYFLDHSHTDRSNFRLKDCINKVDKLISYAVEIGLGGIAITDHETLASHVEAIKFVKDGKKKGTIPEDFTLGLGNEIYLVDREEAMHCKENNLPMKFYHFILIAKDKFGYDGLKELSSLAWENSYWFRGMERVPTYKDDLERIMEKYKGHIIASTACVGSELAQTTIAWVREEHVGKKQEYKLKIHKLMTWYRKVFGDDIYIEVQPSNQADQLDFNKAVINIAEGYGMKTIIATDAHYLNPDYARAHEIYLKADEGEREVAEFYETTYLMSADQAIEFFKGYYDMELIQKCFENTLIMKDSIEEFDLYHEVIVPPIKTGEFELQHLFKDYYEKYEYIRKFAYSPNVEDRFHLYNIELGFIKYKQEFNEVNIARLNTEYRELWKVSEKLDQPVSAYYLLTKKIVDIMWTVSLVGPSRGSAASWYTVYLLGITQVNPIKFNLPHWRHLTAERPEMPDIDIDTEAAQRANILQALKDEFGYENVLNISTLTKEKSKQAILTAARGLGIDKDVAQNIANMVPNDKNGMWTLRECFEGNKEEGKKPVRELVEELKKYPELLKTVEAIEGLVSGRSVHASGIYIFGHGYLKQNALMKTTGGAVVTQFNMQDSDYMGGLKVDALTINALDRIRSCMELLLKEGLMQWKGSLRETFEFYLHPDILEMEEPKMFKMLHEGEILDAFQFDSVVGSQAIQKIKPITFNELQASNSLMRLSPDDGESPLDRFVRHKKNIEEWHKEMVVHGLSDDEIEVVRKHLDKLYGVADTQEIMMEMSMDPLISNFDLTQANKLRKGVAKKSKEVIEECWVMFEEGCAKQGTSEKMKNYVWNSCFKPQFGYSFSLPHIAGYTLILMQEMNQAFKYGAIYWKTACLSVNSGLFGDKEGNTNYGAVSKAVSDMKDTVLVPDINKSDLGFTPLVNENKILYGLKPIAGLGKDALKVVMAKRPFASFEDFVSRAVFGEDIDIYPPETIEVMKQEDNIMLKTITDKKAIILIKAGCFDNLTGMSRRDLMIKFVNLYKKSKDKLTMVQLPHVLSNVPAELSKYVEIYNFRQQLFGRNAKGMTKEMEEYFKRNLMNEVKYTFDNGKLTLDKKEFDKYYNKVVEPLKEWLKSEEAVSAYNKKVKQDYWKENCMGTVEQWEMETISYYSDKHELDYAPLQNYFNISNFNEIEPDHIIEWKTRGQYRYPIFQLSLIAGTVVDKDENKHIVYLSTQHGVVTVKYQKGSFMHYNKTEVDVSSGQKVTLDQSWFKRGTKLVVVGRRRGNEFVPKVYKDTPYKHTTMKIAGFNDTEVFMQLEKIRA